MTDEQKNKNDNPAYYPMFISEDVTSSALSSEESLHVWRVFRALPEAKRAIIAAPGTTLGIQQLHQSLHLGEFSVRMVSLVVRKILFGEWDEDMARRQLEIVLSEEGKDVSLVGMILDFIKKKIFVIQEVATEAPDISLSLMQALGKFEKLGGQQVTNSKIVVRGQNDPVRPTIFNWLKAYRDELGVGAHDAVSRGQFLFHSLNGKGLSSDEREQIGMLLKSLDENSPLTIDAGRQEVIFSKQQVTTSLSSDGGKQRGTRTTVVPPAGGASAVREPLPTLPLERGGGVAVGNISRAVFDLPMVKGTTSLSSDGGKQEMENRPSAFEPAKAIQEANREARLSISNFASETVELGKMDVPREEVRPAVTPRSGSAPVPQSAAPAPRAISFEPAKIDNFSFGASTVAPNRTSVVPPARIATRIVAGGPANGDNVGSVSFSTKHVMPAERESINSQQITDNGERKIGNSGLRQPTDQKAQQPQTAGAPARGGQAAEIGAVPIPAQSAPAPMRKAPIAPVNRYRITPTGHRDEAANDDTPSPHVVDLRG